MFHVNIGTKRKSRIIIPCYSQNDTLSEGYTRKLSGQNLGANIEAVPMAQMNMDRPSDNNNEKYNIQREKFYSCYVSYSSFILGAMKAPLAIVVLNRCECRHVARICIAISVHSVGTYH